MTCDYCKSEVVIGERFCIKHKVYICEEHSKLFYPSNDLVIGKKCDFCITQKIMEKRLRNANR